MRKSVIEEKNHTRCCGKTVEHGENNVTKAVDEKRLHVEKRLLSEKNLSGQKRLLIIEKRLLLLITQKRLRLWKNYTVRWSCSQKLQQPKTKAAKETC